MKLLVALMIGVVFGLAACATGPRYYVETDSLAAQEPFEGKTFHLWPMDPEIDPNGLQYKEYETYAERALALRGLERVDIEEEADLLVMFGYGIGQPRTEMFSYVVPVQGVTGTTSTTNASANVFGSGNSIYGQGTSTTNTKVNRGTVGYSAQTGSRTVYDRFVLINGRFIDMTKQMSEWAPAFETTVTSSGSSADLRLVLPVMLAAAADKLATNTGKKVSDIMSDSDDNVLAIKAQKSE